MHIVPDPTVFGFTVDDLKEKEGLKEFFGFRELYGRE